MSLNNRPEALFVDIIGTVVNWRSVVTNCLSTGAKIALSPSSPTSTTIPLAVRTQAEKTNWRNIAEEWHDSYISFSRTYSPAPNPSSSFTNFDDHMLPALTAILEAHNLAGLFDPEEIPSYARIWHYLDPYPDSVAGISALKKFIPVYALSNGNTSLLADMAVWNKIDYTGIFSAEEFKRYGPSAAVYEAVAEKVQLVEKGKCGLVSARLGDLKVAKGLGWYVVYVQREGEEDWSEAEVVRAKEEGWVDLWVGEGGDRVGLVQVAARLSGK